MAKQPTDKKPDEQPPTDPPPADESVTLTKAELQKLIDDNRAEVERASKERIEKERETEREQRDREEAEKQGKFKELADAADEKRAKAESERDAAKLEARTLSVKDALRAYLAKNHADYSTAADWMMPALKFDLATEPAEIDKQIKAVAEKYVADNPRKGGQQIPGNPPTNPRIAKPGKKPGDSEHEDRTNGEPQFSRVARQAF